MSDSPILRDRYYVRGQPRTITIIADNEWSKVSLTEEHKEHLQPVASEQLESRKLVIASDYSIRIPRRIAKKLGWKIGTELWIDVEDERLKQAILGTKFSGPEASEALEELRRFALEHSEAE